MTAHRIADELFEAAFMGHTQIPDPGASGIINVDKSPAYVDLVTADPETRTLKDPAGAGLILVLNLFTDGGDCTVTADSAINQAGNTIITFGDANDNVMLYSIRDGAGTFAWRIANNDGTALT